jgi:ubiquinone/menaquinone biosynthesis C-methylase UbiE
MKRIENELDIISKLTVVKDKTIIDVGCGTGGLVQKLAEQGAGVIGIDRHDMLVKAKNNQMQSICIPAAPHDSARAFTPRRMKTNTNELAQHIGSPRRGVFTAGLGENLPFKNNSADIIIFFASFHHIPEQMMMQTLQETYRVLKAGGIGIFLEPIGREGSYFEIIRLVEDERDIQQLAFESIKKAHTFGLENKSEEIIYVERSFDDYVNLLNIFVEDEAERNGYLKEAGKITEGLSQEAGIPFEDYRFKSICRINVLQKS